MSTHADSEITIERERAARDGLLIAQLRRVHHELHATLALAAQIPPGERYDSAVHHLHAEIIALGREFLRLSGELLARGDVAAAGGNINPMR